MQQATSVTDAASAILTALGGGDPLDRARLTADPVVSIADSDDGLPPRALVTRDPDEAARAIGARRLGTVTPTLAATDGPVSFVEARCERPDGTAGSLLLTATADAAGAIDRLVILTGGIVDPPTPEPVGHHGRWPDARRVLDRYFEDLEASEFAAAAAWFSEDCLYSHPPYAVGDARVDFRGRASLLDGFVNRRGKTSSRHGLLRVVQDGRHGFIEGYAGASHISDGSTFLSSFSLDADGLIERYVAYYAAPQVPVR